MFFARIVRNLTMGFALADANLTVFIWKVKFRGGGMIAFGIARTSVFINFIVFIFILLSLIEWRNTSYFSSSTIQTVLIFYKNYCRVVLLTKTQENIFYNCFFFCKSFGLCTLLAWPFFPFFTNVQYHIIKNWLTSTVRAVRENIQPRRSCVLAER
jgi:hypothetical protein